MDENLIKGTSNISVKNEIPSRKLNNQEINSINKFNPIPPSPKESKESPPHQDRKRSKKDKLISKEQKRQEKKAHTAEEDSKIERKCSETEEKERQILRIMKKVNKVYKLNLKETQQLTTLKASSQLKHKHKAHNPAGNPLTNDTIPTIQSNIDRNTAQPPYSCNSLPHFSKNPNPTQKQYTLTSDLSKSAVNMNSFSIANQYPYTLNFINPNPTHQHLRKLGFNNNDYKLNRTQSLSLKKTNQIQIQKYSQLSFNECFQQLYDMDLTQQNSQKINKHTHFNQNYNQNAFQRPKHQDCTQTQNADLKNKLRTILYFFSFI